MKNQDNKIKVEQVVNAIVEDVLNRDDRVVDSVYSLANRIGKEKFGIDDLKKSIETDSIDVYFDIYDRLREKSRDKSNLFSMRAVPSHEMQWGMPYAFDYIFRKKKG